MSSKISTFFYTKENVGNDSEFLIDVDSFLNEDAAFEASMQELFEKSLISPRLEVVNKVLEQVKK